jgi:hypothetical protein
MRGGLWCESGGVNVPSVLPSSHRLPSNRDALLTAHHRERNNALDLRIHRRLFGIILLIFVRIHANVMESKLLLNAVLEQLSLFEGQAVGFCDDGDDVDGFGELLQDNDVDGFKGMAGGSDEVETAVDAGVLNIPI